MKWLRGFHEVREAKYKADAAKIALQKAKTELDESERERKIKEYYDQIQAECDAHPTIGFAVPNEPKPAPGDDPELLKEAYRRYMRDLKERMDQGWRRRF